MFFKGRLLQMRLNASVCGKGTLNEENFHNLNLNCYWIYISKPSSVVFSTSLFMFLQTRKHAYIAPHPWIIRLYRVNRPYCMRYVLSSMLSWPSRHCSSEFSLNLLWLIGEQCRARSNYVNNQVLHWLLNDSVGFLRARFRWYIMICATDIDGWLTFYI